MKKQYISPESQSSELGLDSLLTASITGIDKGDLSNPIEIGGEAEAGSSSDSRRSIWADEEEDYEY